MNLHQPLAVIALTALITTFAMASFAKDDGGKDDAVKDKGGSLPSHVLGCTLTITSPDVILYSNRGLQGAQLGKVPPGKYQPVEYRKGWHKIRALGWVAWIQDPLAGPKKAAIQKTNCPDKNKDD